MSRSAGAIVTVWLSLGLFGCGGAATPTSGPPVGASPTPLSTSLASTVPPASSSATATAVLATAAPTIAPTPTPAPTSPASTFSLAASIWWSGFEIAVSGGTFDASKHTLTIDATFTNSGTQASELRNLSDGTSIDWNGQRLPGFEPSGLVNPGQTASAQISVAVPPNFVTSAAVLTFGKPGQHQALVPFDGSAASSERPSALAISGKVTMGKYVTYTITSAMLVPAACTGYPNRIKYSPLASDKVSIVMFGTAASKDATNYRQIDNGYLVLPDASKLTSDPAFGVSLALSQSIPNEALCFAVTPPLTGTYTLKMHEYRSNATGSLVLTLP